MGKGRRKCLTPGHQHVQRPTGEKQLEMLRDQIAFPCGWKVGGPWMADSLEPPLTVASILIFGVNAMKSSEWL